MAEAANEAAEVQPRTKGSLSSGERPRKQRKKYREEETLKGSVGVAAGAAVAAVKAADGEGGKETENRED